MKKAVSAILLILLLLLALPVLAEASLSIVSVNFPEYDLARAIAGEEAEVTMLLPPGSESHSFEPTPQDIITIANANLFFYNGGESDTWARTILESLGDAQPVSLRMMDCVQLVSEERTESMSGEIEEEEAPDEHVWTSLRNMKQIAAVLCDTLCALAPQQEADFRQRTEAYLAELTALDEAFTQVVESSERKLLIFGDRFPFRYFVEDYGLSYDAAFPGCSEQTEPNVNTIISLTQRILSEKIPVVLTLEFSSGKTADILCEETGAVRRTFHSCHTVSTADLENGVTYLSLMRDNLAVLEEALNGWH